MSARKQPNHVIPAANHDEFKRIVCEFYPDFVIEFIRHKARVHPFSPARVKLTWQPTTKML